MSVSIHLTRGERKASATAYLVDEYNESRWATLKVLGKNGYAEKVTLFISEFTAREMLTALTEVVAEFDAQAETETASETDNE